MTESRDDDFVEVIGLLEDNKKFPYYSAERRVDLFFTYYAERILTEYYGEKIIFVAPEFPIRHKGDNQAENADLLCAFASNRQPIVVELKTDNKSFNKIQLEKYVDRAKDWGEVMCGLVKIIPKSNYRVKYFHLMQRLVKKGLAEYSEGSSTLVERLNELISAESRKDKAERSRKIIELAEGFRPVWSEGAVVMYVAPDKTLEKVRVEFPMVERLSFKNIKIPDSDELESYSRFVKLLHTFA